MTFVEIATLSPTVKVASIGSTMMGPASTAARNAVSPDKPQHPFKQLPSMGRHATMMQAKGYAMPGVMDYGAEHMKNHSVTGIPKLLAQATRFMLPPRPRAGLGTYNPFSGVDMTNPINRFYANSARATGHMLHDRLRGQTAGGGQSNLWQALPSLLQLLG